MLICFKKGVQTFFLVISALIIFILALSFDTKLGTFPVLERRNKLQSNVLSFLATEEPIYPLAPVIRMFFEKINS